MLNWDTIFVRPGYTNIFTQSSTFAPCLGSVCAWWGLRRLPRWRRCTSSDWVSCRQNRWRAHSSAVRGLSGQNIAGGKECLATSFEPQLFRTNCTLLTIGIGNKDKALGTFWGHNVYIVPLKSYHHFFTSFAKFWQIVASIRYTANNYYKKDGGQGEFDNNQLRHLIAIKQEGRSCDITSSV